MIPLSTHFQKRRQQRGLRRDVFEFILEFGEMRFARNADWFVIERKTLPSKLKNTSLAKRAASWLLLVKDGVLITCYRTANPLRNFSRSQY